MLDMFSKAIVKNHKAIIIAWIAITLASFPFFQGLSQVLSYEIDPFIPEDIEAKKVERIIDEKFDLPQEPMLIIVVKADDVTDDKVKVFIESLKTKIEENLKDHGLKEVNTLTSTYEKVLNKYWEFMNKTFRSVFRTVKENITRLNMMVYSLRNNVTKTHSKLYSIADNLSLVSTLLYLPAMTYVNVWNEIVKKVYIPSYPNMSIFSINSMANSSSWEAVKEKIPRETFQLTFAYHNAFFLAWNSSFADPLPKPEDLYDPNPLKRAQLAIKEALDSSFSKKIPFSSLVFSKINITQWMEDSVRNSIIGEIVIDLASGGDKKIKPFLEAVYSLGRDLNEKKVKNFVINIASGNVPQEIKPLLEPVYDLGPNPSQEYIDGLASSYTNVLMEEIKEENPPPPYPHGIPAELLSRFVNDDLTVTLVYVRFSEGMDRRSLENDVVKIRKILNDASVKGIDALVTGGAALSLDIEEIDRRDIQRIDRVTVTLVIVLLGIMLASLIAPVLPLMVIGSAIILSQSLLYFLATAGIDLYFLVRSTMVVIMLGAGVDYAIFMIYRYYEERAEGRGLEESVERAVKNAGEAILSSGGTTMVGFGSLALSRLGMLRSVGLGLALGIGIAMIMALTVVPSLLMVLGDRVNWPRKGRIRASTRAKYLKKISQASVKRPGLVVIVFLAATLVFSLYALQAVRTYDDLSMIPLVEAKEGLEIIAKEFSPGLVSSVTIIARLPSKLVVDGTINKELYRSLSEYASTVASLDGIDKVYGPTSPLGRSVSMGDARIEDVKNFLAKDGTTVMMRATLSSLYSADKALSTVERIRKESNLVKEDLGIREILVGGFPAALLDISRALDEDYVLRIIPAVIVGIFLILIALLRSLLIPLRLIATILMTVIWTVGSLTILFQVGLDVLIYWIVPVYLFSVLMGLGMDYDIFLVSRIKEEVVKGAKDEEATVKSVERTGLVITASGIIMATALGSLMLSSNMILIQIGFALSLAIAIDAFLVRLFLVPSVMMLLKKWNWWPWLKYKEGSR